MNALPQLIHLSDQEFESIRQLVHRHCGINLTPAKKELVRSRLSSLLRRHGLDSFKDYLELLHDPKSPEFIGFINRLSTNLTSFFREARHFDYLESVYLTARLAQAPAALRLRGWSAACSTGEEPYSLAMVLHEKLARHPGADVKLLASDISTSVLEKARAGRYAREQLKTVPPQLARRHFAAVAGAKEGLFEVGPHLKKMVHFKQINLVDGWPFITPLDFIFCRNVFIYFDKATHNRLVARFHELLKPGGLLFVGHSETLTSLNHSFKSAGPAIYIK